MARNPGSQAILLTEKEAEAIVRIPCSNPYDVICLDSHKTAGLWEHDEEMDTLLGHSLALKLSGFWVLSIGYGGKSPMPSSGMQVLKGLSASALPMLLSLQKYCLDLVEEVEDDPTPKGAWEIPWENEISVSILRSEWNRWTSLSPLHHARKFHPAGQNIPAFMEQNEVTKENRYAIKPRGNLCGNSLKFNGMVYSLHEWVNYASTVLVQGPVTFKHKGKEFFTVCFRHVRSSKGSYWMAMDLQVLKIGAVKIETLPQPLKFGTEPNSTNTFPAAKYETGGTTDQTTRMWRTGTMKIDQSKIKQWKLVIVNGLKHMIAPKHLSTRNTGIFQLTPPLHYPPNKPLSTVWQEATRCPGTQVPLNYPIECQGTPDLGAFKLSYWVPTT
eukprot:Gb_19585 [translate_table: standard]